MPQRIFMQIINNRGSSNYPMTNNNSPLQPSTPYRGLDLKSPMVSRIYTAKPGCSSCGK